MDLTIARRLIAEIPEDALVVDVGGGASPFPRADYVIDALPFDEAGAGSHGSAHKELGIRPRFSPDTWIQVDVCTRTPWPVTDKRFDFVLCSHLLEDIRDPIWVCTELQRIGKAGYIEVPSRVEEQTLGVEHPRYAGYYHHRWLISREKDTLVFRHKPHNLHVINDAIITKVGPGWRINPAHSILSFEWSNAFEATELLEFSEDKTVEELCQFAALHRELQDLRVQVPMDLNQRLRKQMYFSRLARGQR